MGFLVPLIIAIIPVFFSMYGNSEHGICWIKVEDGMESIIWMLALFDVPLWIAIVVNTILF